MKCRIETTYIKDVVPCGRRLFFMDCNVDPGGVLS